MAMPYASLSPARDRRSSPAATATATASRLPFCRYYPFSAGNGAGEKARADGGWLARPVPFTAAQYKELEHQALIYKYLVAGVPVPSNLVHPIRRGVEDLAARVYHNYLGIRSELFRGKKVDPEPGRCRRTDGKKWRCAKEAFSDSKYCERHMHRGRNRSRKPVETQLVPHSQPPPAASAVPPLATGFQSHSLYPAIGGGGGGGNSMSSTFSSALGPPQPHMAPYAALGGGGTCKDFRYTAYGVGSLADEHSKLITEAINTSMESPWCLPPSSETTTFPLPSYPPQLGATSELGQNNNSNSNSNAAKAERQQQQPLGDFDSGAINPMEQDNQTLRPFFDEWPKARDSWSDLTDDNSSLASFSATQLSMSIPDFSVASSQSPNSMLFAGEMY
ncbi:growth-regulating factor 4-like [Hordeum vulgare]|uniref:Growth-regulating factor n=1 Tax=Hordeum vulgare subsp. vulgare TaxID=112509 RepID=A0A287UJ13_HORVV|nr:growth-regulating factor 4-like isoform X2 [Hordeum vulgare subsp. vulgare]KAE8813605.1 growth-regulating factor 4-like [Hordeum vulgare]KAI4963385.1 hypothetical protein ZWY2020_014177 [Hordeum vulgare]KAI4981339.1 hypothetical protein ZWY2020_021824 [Hordeum vulgare]